MRLTSAGEDVSTAAAKAGMCDNTGRRYRRSGQLPSAVRPEHKWRTRPDPLEAVWPELEALLEAQPGLQGTTLFSELGRRYPGRFAGGQLRTLQRHLKRWRATTGPGQPVMFPQQHYPGQLGASDFCHLGGLGITIAGQPFDHLLYHFVLTYSNWETGSICASESFESLSAGLQEALWELGGVPQRHRTDCLTAAVYQLRQLGQVGAGGARAEFTRAYQGLLDHYGMAGEHIQAGQAHENGDVEQRHYRFRTALEQALLLRGSRDFGSRQAYELWVRQQFQQLNGSRRERLAAEQAVLGPLPATRLDAATQVQLRVGPSSTIRVQHNTYSVPSRLIGELVQVRLHREVVEVWYAQQLQERLPRLRGSGQHHICYRHVIDSLVRKPGAFAQYRWRADLFPSSHFRQAYDVLQAAQPEPRRAAKEYLAILLLAARESESGVQEALRLLLLNQQPISAGAVAALLPTGVATLRQAGLDRVQVAAVNLHDYDALLSAPPSLAPPSLVPRTTEVGS